MMQEEPFLNRYSVPIEAEGLRFDTWLARQDPDHSRTYYQQLIKDGRVTLNGKVETKGSTLLIGGEEIIVDMPPADDPWPHPQDLPIEICYEDSDVILVNKASGMIVHPAAGNPDGTLVNALLYHCKDLPGINGVKRPGLVHRLDRETTGMMVVAKNDVSMKRLSKQIMNRQMSRLYVALICGEPSWDEKTVETTIGRHPTNRVKRCVDGESARSAVTHFRVLLRNRGFTLLRCQLDTGRTHQIRVHCEHEKFPILGDRMYGGFENRAIEKLGNLTSEKKSIFQHYSRPFLHARTLTLLHPEKHQWMSFTAPLPEDSLALAQHLFPNQDVETYLNEHVFDERERNTPPLRKFGHEEFQQPE